MQGDQTRPSDTSRTDKITHDRPSVDAGSTAIRPHREVGFDHHDGASALVDVDGLTRAVTR